MSKIKNVKAREIIDSRGNPTVEATVFLDNDIEGTASIPSGASVGSYEAVELRDNDPNRFGGMGVLRAVKNVNDLIAPRLKDLDPASQKDIDNLLIALDGTKNKSTLGANAILSVSLAIARASSKSLRVPLYMYLNNLAKQNGLDVTPQVPTPLFNVINGGKHGAGNLDFQEFHIIPASYKPFSEKLQIGVEVYHSLKKVLTYRNAVHSVGDEGGFAPNLFTNMDALEVISEAVKQTYYALGNTVFLGLDVAASSFKNGDEYHIKDRPAPLNAKEMIDYYTQLNNEYHLLLLEDGLCENDWKGWKDLTSRLGSTVIIVGDDLLVTNIERLQKAINEQAAGGIIIKPNQIGTLTETLKVISLAKTSGFKTILSHRSGETTDTFIADLSVAVSADYAKFGAPARGERVSKYNRLLAIEEELRTQSDLP